MRLIKLFFTAIMCAVLSSCSNNTEEAGIDCAESDLDLSVVSSTKSDCDVPGTIEVEAVGGEEPYEYSINEVDFQTSGLFGGLFAGNYSISVVDNQGCTKEVSFTLESEPTGITFNLNSTNTECGSSLGSINAEATGGSGSLTYSIDNGPFSESTTFSDLSAGEYKVSVKDDQNCEVNKTVRVKTNTSLSSDIMPIVEKDCAISGCHNGSQSPRLTTPEAVIQNAGRIKSETQAGSMPRNRTLSDQEIDLIACWVDDGALNN